MIGGPQLQAQGGKFLIVCADDFGSHETINTAVSAATRAGVLTAASLMMGAAATADAVRRARELPQLRVGLHLVLADGQAVLPRELIPSLVDQQGRFGGRMFADGVRFFVSRTARRQLQAEIRAQFAAYARTGLPLDHVNAHKHFHLHPTLLEIVLRVGAEYGMPAMRVPREPFWFARQAGPGLRGPAAAALLIPWIELMKRRLRAAGIAHNDQVFGMACSGSLTEDRMLQILANLPAGVTEIYLHPAAGSERPLAGSPSSYRHQDELAALLSPRVRAAVAASGARCGGYVDFAGSLPRDSLARTST